MNRVFGIDRGIDRGAFYFSLSDLILYTHKTQVLLFHVLSLLNFCFPLFLIFAVLNFVLFSSTIYN